MKQLLSNITQSLCRMTVIGYCLTVILSCGDFIDIDTGGLTEGRSMQIERHSLTIAVGDSYRLPVVFSPDSTSATSIYWESEADSVATFSGDTLHALSPGLTRVVAISAADRLRDTCWVQVVELSRDALTEYPYDMVLYAQVAVDGELLTTVNASHYIVGAYAGEELRGIGQMKRERERDYMEMRVWSPYTEGEAITLRCYQRGEARTLLSPDTLIFDGEMHGTLSSPYPISFSLDSDYEPIYIPADEQEPDSITIILPDDEP